MGPGVIILFTRLDNTDTVLISHPNAITIKHHQATVTIYMNHQMIASEPVTADV